MEHKLVLFASIVALFTYKVSLHSSEVEIHTRQKLFQFGRYVAKIKLCYVIMVTRAGVFIWENVHPD